MQTRAKHMCNISSRKRLQKQPHQLELPSVRGGGRGLPSHFQSHNCFSRSSGLVCCGGWAPLGTECLTRMYQSTGVRLSRMSSGILAQTVVLSCPFVSTQALCEGNFTCKENEVCVRPNECRCRHGYFGASCDTSKGWIFD